MEQAMEETIQDITSNGHVPALAAEGLVYQVQAKRLLDGMSIKAERGSFVGLIGPNGAGKSTLLKTVSGLLHAQEGSVSLEGSDLTATSTKQVARTLAQVSQTPPYTYGFTGVELVLMGRYPHMGRFQVEGAPDRRIASDAMRLTETEEFSDRLVETLSGGERQRVFVASALAQQPHVLLLDEPTSNLDIQHQLKVLDIVQGLVAQGMTAVAAIHDLSLAARYCTSLVLMSGGKVLAEGPAEDVLTSANIEAAFGVRTVVFRDPFTGTLSVSLLDQATPTELLTSGTRVHLVCGGGTGARLMYELQRVGLTVTAGPLGGGDTDRSAADILGIEYVPVTAFGPIDGEACSKHLELVELADIVVLCDVPIGPNNVAVLEALSSARQLVSIEGTPLLDRDFTGGAALHFFESLNPVARVAGVEDAIAQVRALAVDHASQETGEEMA
jgi:iron complex transport system ATP-binding protein